jgi:ATP-dependent RNA helicase SUPV3L1/SUV3
LCTTIGESVEVRKYERLTNLIVESKALNSLLNVQPGDCIVCFTKNDIYAVSRFLEQNNIEVAVIYGSLPPGTKFAQAAKFNDIYHPCKVLVATDAIGMGLNLYVLK